MKTGERQITVQVFKKITVHDCRLGLEEIEEILEKHLRENYEGLKECKLHQSFLHEGEYGFAGFTFTFEVESLSPVKEEG